MILNVPLCHSRSGFDNPSQYHEKDDDISEEYQADRHIECHDESNFVLGNVDQTPVREKDGHKRSVILRTPLFQKFGLHL